KQLEQLATKLVGKKGVIVCGPQMDSNLAEAVVALGESLQAPILADPLSQLRTGKHTKTNIIATYDTIFRSEHLRETLVPDYIMRFGAMSIAESYLFYVQTHVDALQMIVEDNRDVREPTNHASEYIFAESRQFCEDLLPFIRENHNKLDWLSKLQQ